MTPQHKAQHLGFVLSSAQEILAEAAAGRMVILVDDEDRENEGDLVIPAEFATADIINFMAREARGLICLAMDGQMIDRLGLRMMARQNGSRHETAFTVSIEAREGVTTGISASDRAQTIKVAINPQARSADIVSPGHVFPLRARDGGVLARAGHTEAAVDLARLSGLIPAGVICEIMRDDGTMARLDDLIPYAQKHHLKIGTIADLIAHRRKTEQHVERLSQGVFESRYGGEFKIIHYINKLDQHEHLALIKGDLTSVQKPYVRMHALNILQDAMGGGDATLEKAMIKISKQGTGAIVVLRDCMSRGRNQNPNILRDYGVGAQILLDLGITSMVLLTNTPKTVIGLDGYGIEIDRFEPL